MNITRKIRHLEKQGDVERLRNFIKTCKDAKVDLSPWSKRLTALFVKFGAAQVREADPNEWPCPDGPHCPDPDCARLKVEMDARKNETPLTIKQGE